MKKILFIFILLYSGMVFSQRNFLSCSTELEPLLEEVVKEAKERDIYLFDELVKHIDYIILTDNLPIDQYGGLDRVNRVIFIRNKITPIEALITLYHEIGHLFTDNSHPCDICTDIMSTYGVRDHDYYLDLEVYEKELDKYFDYLKNYKR